MPTFDPRIGTDVEETRDFREKFAATARRVHNRSYFQLIFGGVGALVFAPVLFWHPPQIYFLVVVFPLCLFGAIMGIWSFIWSAELKCPSCQERLDELESFCPFCGTKGLYRANIIPQTQPTMRCDRCEKDYYPFKGVNRKYLIRYCTHCDVFLDNDGV
jgi:hypothetical protein